MQRVEPGHDVVEVDNVFGRCRFGRWQCVQDSIFHLISFCSSRYQVADAMDFRTAKGVSV